MNKVTKKELSARADGMQNRFAALVEYLKATGVVDNSIFAPFTSDIELEPKPKVLDQSIFDGLDAKRRKTL